MTLDLHDEPLTYREAAQLARVHWKTLRGWGVKRVRLGRVVRIMKSDLLDYLKRMAA